MNYVSEGLRTAVTLIVHGDPAVFAAVAVSLQVSLTSTVLAAALALPLGYAIGMGTFRGKPFVATLVHGLMSVPTVTIGLLVYAFLSRRGAFGSLGWLYTKNAIVCGQTMLAFPLVTALSLSATESLDRRLHPTAKSLGANSWQAFRAALHEGRFAYLAALFVAFARVISEVGISMMAGGNIRGSTRTITTAIALESSKGEFEVGVALAIILVSLAFFLTGILNALQRRRAVHA